MPAAALAGGGGRLGGARAQPGAAGKDCESDRAAASLRTRGALMASALGLEWARVPLPPMSNFFWHPAKRAWS